MRLRFTGKLRSGYTQHSVMHAGKVFNPKERPWINIDNGTSEVVMHAIDNCPSGALSYQKKSNLAIQ